MRKLETVWYMGEKWFLYKNYKFRIESSNKLFVLSPTSEPLASWWDQMEGNNFTTLYTENKKAAIRVAKRKIDDLVKKEKEAKIKWP